MDDLLSDSARSERNSAGEPSYGTDIAPRRSLLIALACICRIRSRREPEPISGLLESEPALPVQAEPPAENIPLPRTQLEEQ